MLVVSLFSLVHFACILGILLFVWFALHFFSSFSFPWVFSATGSVITSGFSVLLSLSLTLQPASALGAVWLI